MNVSLTKLQHLVTVAKCENVTRAAGELNVSQPALSRNIAQIEKIYGVRIFDRTPQGVVPTQQGRKIIEEARHLLRTAGTFDHNAHLIGEGKVGQVKVGMGPAVASLVMAKACIELLSGSNRISFLAQIRRADFLLKALISEDVDLGLLIQMTMDIPPECETEFLGTVQCAFIASETHPLVGRRNLTVDDIREFPVASVFDLNMREAFRPLAYTVACEDYTAMCEVVRKTDALFFCSAPFARSVCSDKGIVTLDIEIPPSEREFNVLAVTLKGRTKSPAVSTIIECCRKIIAEG